MMSIVSGDPIRDNLSFDLPWQVEAIASVDRV